MANDAVLQVRMDSQVKREVEQLYRNMGTTFSEAVRLFAQQSLLKRRLPFDIVESETAQDAGRSLQQAPTASESGFAMFASYANEDLRKKEKTAWCTAAETKLSGIPAEAPVVNGTTRIADRS